MTYQQIKWLILLIPTITVGLWEYIRHLPFMLNHLSMTMGNWLTPIIVLLVTMIFLVRLFDLLENIQKQLEKEKSMNGILEEREKISRQLHDGIAQSLFLLSVKMNKLENQDQTLAQKEDYQTLKQTVQHIHADVRQAITSLRQPADIESFPWTESLQRLITQFTQDSGQQVSLDWQLPEEELTIKEKVELYACIKEALVNIRKHAQNKGVWVKGQRSARGWVCTIEDDGIGFEQLDTTKKTGYGLAIMRKRVEEMGWIFSLCRQNKRTVVTIKKEEEGNEPDFSSADRR